MMMKNPRGRSAGQTQRRYSGTLKRTTSVRIDDDLREEAEKIATSAGLTFGQFLRQSLRRNIDLHNKIENEIVEKAFSTLT